MVIHTEYSWILVKKHLGIFTSTPTSELTRKKETLFSGTGSFHKMVVDILVELI